MSFNKTIIALTILLYFVRVANAQIPSLQQAKILDIKTFPIRAEPIRTAKDMHGNIWFTTRASALESLNINCPNSVLVSYRMDENYQNVVEYICIPNKRVTRHIFPTNNGGSIGFGNPWDKQNFEVKVFNSSGIMIDSADYGGSHTDKIVTAVQAVDGNFLIFGESYSTDGDLSFNYGSGGIDESTDLWLLKVDQNGQKIWSKSFGGSYYDMAYGIVATPDSGAYLLCGSLSTDHDLAGLKGPGLYHKGGLIIRLDKDGNIIWKKCYGNLRGATFEAGILDGQGGLYVVGEISVVDTMPDSDSKSHEWGNIDGWVIHIDSAGNILWETRVGGPSIDYLYDIDTSSDGTIWVVGFSPIAGGLVPPLYGEPKRGTIAYQLTKDGTYLRTAQMSTDRDHALWCKVAVGKDNIANVFSHYSGRGDLGIPGTSYPYASTGFPDLFWARIAPWGLSMPQVAESTDPLTIKPNPVEHTVLLELNQYNPNNHYALKVYNVQGQLVHQQSNLKAQEYIDMSTWASGVYYFRLNIGEEVIYKKVSKK